MIKYKRTARPMLTQGPSGGVMGAGGIVAIIFGLGIIYGGMMLAVFIGVRMAARDQEQH